MTLRVTSAGGTRALPALLQERQSTKIKAPSSKSRTWCLHIFRVAFLYSYRRHSIGSKREAFLAGQTPKISPTPIDTVNPETIAQVGIEAGMLGIRIKS